MTNAHLHTVPRTTLEIEATLLKGAYDRMGLNIILTVVVTVVFAPMLWQFLPSRFMMMWLAALLVNVVVNTAAWLAFHRSPSVANKLGLWKKVFASHTALSGVSWAVGPTLMIQHATGMEAALFIGILLCVCTVIVTSASEQYFAMLAFVTAALAPVSIAAWFVGGDAAQALALALACGILIMLLVGYSSNQTTRRELKAFAQQAREEESHRLGEQIAHLDRQRSMGEMSAQLAHELNQPLTAILTNAQAIQRGLANDRLDEARQTELNDKIIHNTRRAAEIIVRIREFIQPSALRREPVNLSHVINEVAYLVANDVRRHKVSLDLSGCTGRFMVMGDAVQLSQIVLNVLRNAIDALTLPSAPGAQRSVRVTCVVENERALLRIADSGPGLTPEVFDQAGMPFFTTKASGLGMGIVISRAIATQHGGTLTLSNAPEGGAVIELNLPVLPEKQP